MYSQYGVAVQFSVIGRQLCDNIKVCVGVIILQDIHSSVKVSINRT